VTISHTQFTPGVRRPPAKDILFAAADKSRWLEGLAQDRQLTHYDVRVCVLIGRFVDRRTGQARVGQQSIARTLKKPLDEKSLASATRSVRRSIRRIISLGYLRLVSTGGGRGMASTYEPVEIWAARAASDDTRTPRSEINHQETRTLESINADPTVRTNRTLESSPPNKESLEELPSVWRQHPADPAARQERVNRGGSELVELGRFEELVATHLGIPHGVFIDHVDGERIIHLHRKFRAGADIRLELAELRLKLKEVGAIDRRGSSS
jgi:hypothetical protein